MPDIDDRNPPSVSSALFLGERSPYGLSVARHLLDSPLGVARVFLPSPGAYERVEARIPAPDPRRTGPTGGFARVLRGVRRLVRDDAALIASGEPLPPLVLDPGITVAGLERICEERRVSWERVDEVGSRSFRERLREPAPDLLLCAAFPLILNRRLLEVPTLGAVNFHPSLLPRCRGCHPVFWTLASGEPEGGVSAHFMTREIDAGDLVAQIPLPLSEGDDYGSLYRRAMEASERLVGEVATFFASGRRKGDPQDEGRATYFHEDTEADHRVRWDRHSPAEIACLARTGFAFAYARGERIGVLEAEVAGGPASSPGRVLSVADADVSVSARGGVAALRRLAWRGRGYAAGSLARGLGLRIGGALG